MLAKRVIAQKGEEMKDLEKEECIKILRKVRRFINVDVLCYASQYGYEPWDLRDELTAMIKKLNKK